MRVRTALKHLLASVITIIIIVIINQGTISLLLSSVFRGNPYISTVHPFVHFKSLTTPCLRSTYKFVGKEEVKTTKLDFESLETMFKSTLPGGRFKPEDCASRSRVAVIIPYRDRKTHLINYLFNVIPKLQRQNIDFTIFVVEQATGSMFNRGMMRNIGFEEARKLGEFDCFVFNDVDTIPENDKNMFDCSYTRIRHLVSGIDRYQYRLPYEELLGGIIAFNKAQFIKVNGYSNLFFIWGAEDDDIYRRVISAGYMIERPPKSVGHVTTLKHDRDPITEIRLRLLRATENTAKSEGLNSLKYKVLKLESRKLFTWVYVDINETSVKEHFWSNI